MGGAMLETISAIYEGKAELLSKQIAPVVDKFERGYLYVLRLSNGYTKIGISADPTLRLKSLKRGLRSTGVEFDKLWLSISHINYKDNEKEALAFLADKKKDGEFFKVSFKEALAIVKTLSVKTSYSLKEIEEKEAKRVGFNNWLNDIHGLPRQQ
ncbi:GIY-YIG nuclease family protein [Salmonella enterica subsp. enterica serovar Java]|nr:GIY-YIG nuclease family protein [Salmonella enterica subsp. enterica]EDS8303595.1 GIY-YIG nuclease family protein [Salmonella enterica subsp. enterica serovar Java]EDT6892405.1 GIY-YIG nuclease family protein [Salmonella enterica subsp. enterica serovar Javiana]EDV2567993.1 GIY-YIG nuclease family protein [Salmonella enterica subsp. enterica serovar Miami]EDW3008098.1 GIY-YIG nuclease family protein [Salmonella enterica subsp. enterica serovar Mikawasima]